MAQACPFDKRKIKTERQQKGGLKPALLMGHERNYLMRVLM